MFEGKDAESNYTEIRRQLSECYSLSYGETNAIGIGIAVAKWNKEITTSLLEGALSVLKQCGIDDRCVHVVHVPGSYELPSVAQFLAEHKTIFGIVCLGSLVRGETSHFDIIANTCSNGINTVSLKYNKPITFGVLTDNTIFQAMERSGGKLGNKGSEATQALLEMLIVQKQLINL